MEGCRGYIIIKENINDEIVSLPEFVKREKVEPEQYGPRRHLCRHAPMLRPQDGGLPCLAPRPIRYMKTKQKNTAAYRADFTNSVTHVCSAFERTPKTKQAREAG